MTKYTDVEIDGEDVVADLVIMKKIAWVLEQTYTDNMDEITLNFSQNLGTTVTGLKTTMSLEVWEGYSADPKSTGTKIFSGYVGKLVQTIDGYVVTGFDKLWDAIRNEVTADYDEDTHGSAGKISAIFTDLVNTYTDLTADGTSVQDSGTDHTLGRFVCSHTDVFERMRVLADVLDWQFYFRASTDKVYFEPLGHSLNSNTIYVGGANNNVVGQPKWTEEAVDGLINDLTVIGIDQQFTSTELFAGGGTEFTLAWMPQTVQAFEDEGAGFVEKVGGVVDSSTTYDYYVDRLKLKVIFTDATPAGADKVKVVYNYKIPVMVRQRDEASVATYRLSRRSIFFADVLTNPDAENRVKKILAKRKTPPLTSLFKLKPSVIEALAISIGQKIPVVDVLNGRSLNVIVKKIKRFYPEKDIELTVGDKIWSDADFNADTSERVRRLEEEQFRNQDLLRQLVVVGKNFLLKRKELTVSTRAIGNSAICGHAINGLIGDGLSPQPLLGWQGDLSLTQHYKKDDY